MRHAETIVELRTLSDEELIRRHDEATKHVTVVTQHYLDELRHREGARREARMVDLTAQIRGITVLAVVVAIVALFVAAVSLVVALRP